MIECNMYDNIIYMKKKKEELERGKREKKIKGRQPGSEHTYSSIYMYGGFTFRKDQRAWGPRSERYDIAAACWLAI